MLLNYGESRAAVNALGQFALHAEDISVKSLKFRFVITHHLLPPQAQRRHIVCGRRAYCVIRHIRQVVKLRPLLLRHRLNLESQNLELFHDVGHTIRYHTQILAADNHAARSQKFWEFHHRLVVPQSVVAVIEIFIVDSVVHGFLAVGQCIVSLVSFFCYAWMQLAFVILVLYEQHPRSRREHFLRILLRNSEFFALFIYSPLCQAFAIKFQFAAARSNCELVHHEVRIISEQTSHLLLCETRFCQFLIRHHQTAVQNLAVGISLRLVKLSHESPHFLCPDRPDAEKAEYVVDAIGVEVSLHLLQTILPPIVSVFRHYVPVVCRESPVLPFI